MINNRDTLNKVRKKLPNLGSVASMTKAFKTQHRPSQKFLAGLKVKPLINKKHTGGLSARTVQRMGYPRSGPYPQVRLNNNGQFTETAEAELTHFLATQIAKRKNMNYMTFWLTGAKNMTYNNLLNMESRNTNKSKNSINKKVRRLAPRGMEYAHGNYPNINNNGRRGMNNYYRTNINRLARYQNEVPTKVRGALNKIAKPNSRFALPRIW